MSTHSEFETARRRMIAEHLRRRGIQSSSVLDAMNRVPRERFVPPDQTDQAYADRALLIECGQTISQPYIVALMTEALRLSGREHVLEVGTGSGYQTAILAELSADVISIERHEKLSRAAAELLTELGYRNIRFLVGDGSLGWPEAAPYDRIIVTAATSECPPALFDQLCEGGILVAPVGPADTQVLQAIRKTGRRPQTLCLGACRFVPLVNSPQKPQDTRNLSTPGSQHDNIELLGEHP